MVHDHTSRAGKMDMNTTVLLLTGLLISVEKHKKTNVLLIVYQWTSDPKEKTQTNMLIVISLTVKSFYL